MYQTKELHSRPAVQAPALRLIAWEVTRRCPMHCRHCRASASDALYEGELSTAESLRLIDNLAAWSKPIVILTGGEPLERSDIFTIAQYGTQKGLHMAMASCGWLVDNRTIDLMKEAGIQRLSLSLDGADVQTHDGFRQVSGSFEAVIRAARYARSRGLEFQINTTVSKVNFRQLDDILALSIELGAAAFHPFLLVPTGRASQLAGFELNAGEYEQLLLHVYEKSLDSVIPIKPTCAPQYYRILRNREQVAGRPVTRETHGLNAVTKGCLGGQSFAFISYRGNVYPCGFLEKEAGDLKSTDFKLRHIWESAPLFQQLRTLSAYHGKCGQCEYGVVCGGCRARALAKNGHYLAQEPYCVYQPFKTKE